MSERDQSIVKVLGGAVSGAIAGAATGLHGAAVGAGLGALGAGGERLFALAVQHLRTPADQRLFEAENQLAADALEAVAEPLAEKFEALKEAVGEHEAAASVVPTLQHWSGAWRGAEGKKQRVIMAALVSAFDPESHQAAMTHRFFGLLKQLDYPEIFELCRGVRQLRAHYKHEPVPVSASVTDESSRHGDERTTHRARLDGYGLLRVGNDPRTWSPMWLGLALVAFLERGGYTASPDDDAPRPV